MKYLWNAYEFLLFQLYPTPSWEVHAKSKNISFSHTQSLICTNHLEKFLVSGTANTEICLLPQWAGNINSKILYYDVKVLVFSPNRTRNTQCIGTFRPLSDGNKWAEFQIIPLIFFLIIKKRPPRKIKIIPEFIQIDGSKYPCTEFKFPSAEKIKLLSQKISF